MSVLAVDSVPVPASAGFGVSFVGMDGDRCREPLSSCWMVPFEQVLPVRAFGSHAGKKSFSGSWWLATTADHVGYESWLERDNVMALDFDSDVVGLSSQPFRLSWEQGGKGRAHTPDYFARLCDGTGVVIDVRDDNRIKPEDAEAFVATAQACASVGWEFRRVGAVDAVRAANLRWLAGYRHRRCMDAGRASGLRQAFGEPRPLLDGARQAGDPIAVLPVLYHLANVVGTVSAIPVAELLASPGFALASPAGASAPLPPSGLLDGIPDAEAERARWWERHIVEILTGLPPEHAPGAVPRAEYHPGRVSLRQRELAKVAELDAAGRKTSLATVKRLRLAYQEKGLWGLVDQRSVRQPRLTGRADERVVAAIRKAIDGETSRSTGTVGRLRRETARILEEEHGADAPPLPPDRTFYRLAGRLSQGKHTFGSARTRRSAAKPPGGPFGSVAAARPGEWTQIDSTPLDVRVVLDTGIADRVELTWIIDLATRAIPAAVLRPTTKAADAAVLLARMLTPEPMRPGWADALRMSRSVLPHRRLTELDERLQHAAARPVIVKHGIWLPGPGTSQLSVSSCPDILDAERRARRLLRRFTIEQLIHARIAAHAGQDEYEHAWKHRAAALIASNPRLVTESSPQTLFQAAAYPTGSQQPRNR